MPMPHIRPQAAAGLTLLLALVITASALAQQGTRVIGTVEGTLADEERTWYALDYGEGEPTASVMDFGFGLLSISIVANPEQRFMVEGALSIDIGVMGALECPCVFEDADVTYWSSTSMFSDLYVSDEPGWARVTITRWEQLADGLYALEGEVEAELVYLAGITANPDGERRLQLEATITIDELPEEAF